MEGSQYDHRLLAPSRYKGLGGCTMQIGDLVKTMKGNFALVVEVGNGWCNILFCGSGLLRTGFPSEWLRRVQ